MGYGIHNDNEMSPLCEREGANKYMVAKLLDSCPDVAIAATPDLARDSRPWPSTRMDGMKFSHIAKVQQVQVTLAG